MIRRTEALEYHAGDRPGKLEVKASKACFGPRELRLAYLPGAAFPAEAIIDDPAAIYHYTGRGNLVAAVTNGTAVAGLGDIGPAAAKPIQEGTAVLLKRFADIDVFDLELDVRDAQRFADVVRALEPTFGGIDLKSIRAPEGLAIYDELRTSMSIPVFHEGLYGSAVVACAALLNALDLASKRIDAVRVVIAGAGTVGLGCARLLAALGVPQAQILLYDLRGLIHAEREDLNDYQRAFANADAPRTLADGLQGADVFLGAATRGVVTQAMIRSMAAFPVVFSMAAPAPEISYEDAHAARRDVIVATSLARDPNAILDLLSIPYILRGALDVQASRITEGMMLAAARALAALAREEVPEEVCRAYADELFSFGPSYLLPKPIDPRILVRESAAVAQQAIAEGVARRQVEPERYQESLALRVGSGREMMRQIIFKARQVSPRVAFADGQHETILRACSLLVDEGIASPVLLGPQEEIFRNAERLNLDLAGVTVVDPQRSAACETYAEEYLRLRERRGVTREMAHRRMARLRYFAAMMLHCGDVELLVSGITSHFAESMRTVLETIGPAPGVQRLASYFMVLRPKEFYFLADCAVNIEPDAKTLAEIALATAGAVRFLGIEPRVAMLSFSNFGSADHPMVRKVREATRLAKERAPQLVIDGEIQLITALDGEFRRRNFPFCALQQDANVLIFPDLQSGAAALNLLQKLGDAVAVGPVLVGARRPVQVLQFGCSVADVVNLTAVGAVEAARLLESSNLAPRGADKRA